MFRSSAVWLSVFVLAAAWLPYSTSIWVLAVFDELLSLDQRREIFSFGLVASLFCSICSIGALVMLRRLIREAVARAHPSGST